MLFVFLLNIFQIFALQSLAFSDLAIFHVRSDEGMRYDDW